jgi:hypothetical protein
VNLLEWIGESAKRSLTTWEKRDGQPWLQGTARNKGHAFFGDKHATDFETRYLGDTEDGRRYAADTTPMYGAGQTVLPSMTQQPQQIQPQNGEQMNAIMKTMMQRIAAGQTQQQIQARQ